MFLFRSQAMAGPGHEWLGTASMVRACLTSGWDIPAVTSGPTRGWECAVVTSSPTCGWEVPRLAPHLSGSVHGAVGARYKP